MSSLFLIYLHHLVLPFLVSKTVLPRYYPFALKPISHFLPPQVLPPTPERPLLTQSQPHLPKLIFSRKTLHPHPLKRPPRHQTRRPLNLHPPLRIHFPNPSTGISTNPCPMDRVRGYVSRETEGRCPGIGCSKGEEMGVYDEEFF
jgi:hypothetical protein